MSSVFTLGRRVQLVSFHGKTVSQDPVAPNEDYWILVGENGAIVSEELKMHPAFPEKGKRALVKFDKSMQEVGLVNHNQFPNSLWIFITDLKLLNE